MKAKELLPLLRLHGRTLFDKDKGALFFNWQTISDDPRNAFVLGAALTEAGVPFDLHCFETGHHGVGLADGHDDMGFSDAHLCRWAELCASWLQVHGI